MYTIPSINHDHHFNISNKSIFKIFISEIVPCLDQSYLCSAQDEPRVVTLH